MPRISAIVISKNSEEVIAGCLESLKFCDEIIVVDSSSEDKTISLAQKFGAKTYSILGLDFSQLRNLGLEKATGDWVLYVDTDERVTSELARNIKYQISNIKYKNVAAYKLKRKNFYFGKNEWPYIEKLERLFKKKNLRSWYGKIHESPKIDGKVDIMDGYLLHYTHRNLSSMVEKTIEWSKTEAEIRFKANHPRMSWWRFPRVMATAFLESYIRQRGYKAGVVGLVESIYQSFSIFITYARLWELQNKK